MISYLVPTVGRPSLADTLASIECWPGDEIVIVSDARIQVGTVIDGKRVRFIHCPRGNDWGHKERNFAMPLCEGRYIAHIDDDDVFAPGTRAAFQRAIDEAPDRPAIFKMRFPCGITLYMEPAIRCGNVGTPMFLTPNKPEMFGTWGSFVGGDCSFLETSKWRPEEYAWRPEVVALLGHDVG